MNKIAFLLFLTLTGSMYSDSCTGTECNSKCITEFGPLFTLVTPSKVWGKCESDGYCRCRNGSIRLN